MNLNNYFESILNFYNTIQQESLIYVLLIISICIFSYFISKFLFIQAINRLSSKSFQIDDYIIKNKTHLRLSAIIPFVVCYFLLDTTPYFSSFKKIIISVMIYLSYRFISSILSLSNDIFRNSHKVNKIDIKGYIQLTKIILSIFTVFIIIVVLTGTSLSLLLSSIGALTAVIILIFKDTILSFIATIQITSNNIVKIGDWIEVPQFNADGDVIDIGLHFIKVQNWNKTISVIPTYKLIDSSFKNWSGMSASGGRRIKRSIMIDINSIKFCTHEMIEKYHSIELIKDYINEKKTRLNSENNKNEIPVNSRRITNIGTFRYYIGSYLKSKDFIHSNLTFLIRQLEPTPSGLPIEIYAFINDTDWIKYENIQSDIFDHLLSILKEFDLKAFQNPSGNDFRQLKNL